MRCQKENLPCRPCSSSWCCPRYCSSRSALSLYGLNASELLIERRKTTKIPGYRISYQKARQRTGRPGARTRRRGPRVSLTWRYQDQGQYAKAEPRYRRALAIREKALGPEHPEVASSLNRLAHFYHDQEQYAKAEPLYLRALAIRNADALNRVLKIISPELENSAQPRRSSGS
jgi:tetratricopeptide (TPR) repeat protein